MLIDIIFVVVVVGLLVAIYKLKFKPPTKVEKTGNANQNQEVRQ